MLALERAHLTPLPAVSFDAAEHSRVRVNQKSLVTVRQNYYSVPSKLIGVMVDARINAGSIEILRGGSVLATHQRLAGRYQTSAKLDHYVELLACKPGAFAGSQALAQERERGDWPAAFDRLWQLIEERHGRSAAAAQMVDVLLLIREHGARRVADAVRAASTAAPTTPAPSRSSRGEAISARRCRSRASTNDSLLLAVRRQPLPTTTSCSRSPDERASK